MAQKKIKHVAIIMDGNGRWATAQRLPRLAGHKAGADALEQLVEYLVHNRPEVQYLTVFAFAIKNQTRDKSEVDGLAALFDHEATAMLPGLKINRVRTRVVGDRSDSYFTPRLLAAVARLEDGTQDGTALNYQIAWNYSGQNEIARAQAAGFDITRLYETMFDAQDVPPIDLLVRTGVDNEVGLNIRDSDFFPLLSTKAVKYPNARLWPDFRGETDLEEAIAVWEAEAHLDGGQRPQNETMIAAQ